MIRTLRLTDSLTVNQLLPGVHKLRRIRGERHIEYWYAWRGAGAPLILSASGETPGALARDVARLAPAAITKYQELSQPVADRRTLHGLITRYLMAMEDNQALAPRTKTDRRKRLDVAREELGEMEIRALESRKARPYLISWRDKRSVTPKTADDLLGDLSTVLTWAADRGEILRNPLVDFPRIYKVNRSEVIWEPHHLELLLQHADDEAAQAVRLAAATGLRKGDLIKLPWTAVGENAIAWQTGKSRGRKTVIIPMTPEVRAALTHIPRRGVTILASSEGTPWKAPGYGLDSAVYRARQAVLEHVQKTHGPDAKSPLEGLRFHDLRGTAATNFIRAGVEPADVAVILGWDIDRVMEIGRRYVTAEAFGAGIVARFEKKKRTERKQNL